MYIDRWKHQHENAEIKYSYGEFMALKKRRPQLEDLIVSRRDYDLKLSLMKFLSPTFFLT